VTLGHSYVHDNSVMDTMEHAKRKKVQAHPMELRRQVLDERAQPGASVAKVALAHGLNANLVHLWRKQQREQQRQDDPPATPEAPQFIALPMPPRQVAAAVADIRIELRRGATTVAITWPAEAARECAVWLQGWLK